MTKRYYDKADYYQTDDELGLISIEVEDFTDSTNIGEHYWDLVTDPVDYSGTGAMQALPDIGTLNNSRYFERSSRLDYAVDFVKTGTHYIWIRAYAPSTSSNILHMGINFIEERNASRIGFKNGTGQWEWIHKHSTVSGMIRSFEVEGLGTQPLSLWFGADGVIADKIVITSDPDFVPTGLGPDLTIVINQELDQLTLPQGFDLHQNYPNPFNPSTRINFSLPYQTKVRINMYDIRGRKVAELINGEKSVGTHEVNFEAKNLSSGVYIYQLEYSGQVISKKMLLIK